MPLLNAIREVYGGLEAVYDLQDRCIGVIVKSRRFPYTKAFFCCINSKIYHGFDSLGVVIDYFRESKKGGEQ